MQILAFDSFCRSQRMSLFKCATKQNYLIAHLPTTNWKKVIPSLGPMTKPEFSQVFKVLFDFLDGIHFFGKLCIANVAH